MELIKITLEKLDEIINLYKDAIVKMEKSNIFQWDEMYPDKNDLENDIIKEQMYGILIDKEIVSAFVINKEFDKEYLNIKWKYRGNNYRELLKTSVFRRFPLKNSIFSAFRH